MIYLIPFFCLILASVFCLYLHFSLLMEDDAPWLHQNNLRLSSMSRIVMLFQSFKGTMIEKLIRLKPKFDTRKKHPAYQGLSSSIA